MTSLERGSESSTIHRLGWAVSHPGVALQRQHDPADPSLQQQASVPLNLNPCADHGSRAGGVEWPDASRGAPWELPYLPTLEEEELFQRVDFHSQLSRKLLLLPPSLTSA